VPQARQEWPLVFFTAVAPAGVGAGVLLSSWFSQYRLDSTIFPAALVLGATIALAFAVSAVHIGRIMRMPRAVRNLFRSWLSREVFLMSISCALYIASALMYYFRRRYGIEDRFVVYTFWAAPGVGILGLLSMQRVYVVRSVNLWTGPRVFSMVFSSAFLLGGMEAVLILHLLSGKSPVDMLWHFQPVFLAPLFFDALHAVELKRLGKRSLLAVFGVLRLPVYLTVFHALGRVDLAMLSAAMGLALTGDLLLRLFFFNEPTTSFRREMKRARMARLMGQGISGPPYMARPYGGGQ
jgi:DMSO reductase anchor subunit